jgi:hypothetical protein
MVLREDAMSNTPMHDTNAMQTVAGGYIVLSARGIKTTHVSDFCQPSEWLHSPHSDSPTCRTSPRNRASSRSASQSHATLR